MTTADPEAPIISIVDEPGEEDDVGHDALVDYGTSLLKELQPQSLDEELWLNAAANRLDQRFREALHGSSADPGIARRERKSRP